MLKLHSLLTFVATAETGSISEAARRLQISKSVASDRLAELERNVGATLIRRSTRKLVLTEAGITFVERAARRTWNGVRRLPFTDQRVSKAVAMTVILACADLSETPSYSGRSFPALLGPLAPYRVG